LGQEVGRREKKGRSQAVGTLSRGKGRRRESAPGREEENHLIWHVEEALSGHRRSKRDQLWGRKRGTLPKARRICRGKGREEADSREKEVGTNYL
jgi:hypothetical protein